MRLIFNEKGVIKLDLYFKGKDNEFIKVKEIETINENSECLIFSLKCRIREEELMRMEEMLTLKTGKNCVVLDYLVDKVVGI